MGPGPKGPAAPAAGRTLTGEEKFAVMLAEADKYERAGDELGRLMAQGIRRGIATLRARQVIETASAADRSMLRDALNAVDAAELAHRVLP